MANKTYKAETMLEALQMVQQELGPDAIVVSARNIPLGPAWNAWKRTGIEVVAMPPGSLPARIQKDSTPQSNILRPTGNGVEFVEDSSQIDWVAEPAPKTSPTPARAAIPSQPVNGNSAVGFRSNPTGSRGANGDGMQQGKGSVQPVRWQPAHISKEEAKAANLPPLPETHIAAENAIGMKTAKTAPAEKVEASAAPLRSEPELPRSLLNIQRQLVTQGIDQTLVDKLMKLAMETFGQGALSDEAACRKYLAQFLEAELRGPSGLGLSFPNRVVCLIGASGHGKTSTTAKLALFFSQKLGKKVVWISADTLRTGAIAEARAFTDALGVTLHIVYTPEDLKQALAESTEADLVLVDTPGYNPCSENQMVELGAILTEIPRRCTYLVTSATTRESDLFQMTAALGIFSLDGLIVSKLDETYSYGSVYNFARKSRLPLSYFATGKEVIGNLEVASAARLVSGLLGKGWIK